MNIRIFRWLLVIPSGVGSWYGILFLGIAVYGLLKSFCPEEEMISGACMAAWWTAAERIIIVLFSGISAVAVVIVPTVVAPEAKKTIAISSYVAGSIVALWMAVEAEAWFELLSALIFGGITTVLVVKIFSPNQRLQPTR